MTNAAHGLAQLPLSLDFAWGRGFVSARDLRPAPWVHIEFVQIELPDLRFPVDIAGGVGRFRDTRGQTRRAAVQIDVGGLAARMRVSASAAVAWTDVRVELEGDALAVTATSSDAGALTFRLLLASEHADAARVVLRAESPVVVGALRMPAPLAVASLLATLVGTSGDHATLGLDVVRDSVVIDPLRAALGEAFVARGWKLPGDETLVGELGVTRDGRIRWTAVSPGAPPGAQPPTDGALPYASAGTTWELFEDAEQALFSGDLAGALVRYDEAAASIGDHRIVAARRIELLASVGERASWARAEELVEARLERAPDDPTAWHGRARLAALRGDEAAEATALDALLATLPPARRAARGLIKVALAGLSLAPRPQRARQLLNEVLATSPRDTGALRLRAADARSVGDLTVLADTLRRLAAATTSAAEQLSAWRELAHLALERSGDLDGARLYLQRARELAPDDASVRLEAGRLYARAGRATEAIAELTHAAEAMSRHGDRGAAQAWAEAAALWTDPLDDAESAAITWQQALRAAPDDVDIVEGAVRALAALRRFDEALRRLHEPLSRVEARFDASRDDEARRALARMLRLSLDLDRARGHDGDTTETMRRLAALGPGAADASEALVDRFRSEGRDDELVPLLRARLAAAVDNDERDATRAALAGLVEPAEAFSLLCALGDDADAEGRPEDAAVAWQRALSISDDQAVRARLEALLQRVRAPDFEHSRFYLDAREALMRARHALMSTTPAPRDSVGAPATAVAALVSSSLSTAVESTPVAEADARAALDAARAEGEPDAIADALAGLADAVTDAFDEADLRVELAALLAGALGRAGDARAHAFRATTLDPDGAGRDPDVLALLGEERDDGLDATLAGYRERLDGATDDASRAVYHLLIGDLLLDEGAAPAEALVHAEAVLDREPTHAPARRLRADALARLRRFAESAAELRWLGEHPETDPFERQEVRRLLADMLASRLDAAPAALDVLEAVLDDMPGDSDAIGQYKRICASSGAWGRAAEMALRELALLAGRLDPFPTLDEALDAAQALPTAMRPTGARVLAEVTGTLMRAGQSRPALAAARIAARLDVDEPAAWEALAAAAEACEEAIEAADALDAIAALLLDAREAASLRERASALRGAEGARHSAPTRPHLAVQATADASATPARAPRPQSDPVPAPLETPTAQAASLDDGVAFAELAPGLDARDRERVEALQGASVAALSAALGSALQPALRRALLVRLGHARLDAGGTGRDALLPLKGALILDDRAVDTRFALGRAYAVLGDTRNAREQLDELAAGVGGAAPAWASAEALCTLLLSLEPDGVEEICDDWRLVAPELAAMLRSAWAASVRT